MTGAGEFVRAKRGDGIVVHERRTTYTVGQEPPQVPYDAFEVGVVTAIWPAGVVREWRPCWVLDGQDYSAPLPPAKAVHVIRAADFDIPAVIKAAREHAWPDGQAKPFGSADEAKAALRHARKPRRQPRPQAGDPR